MQKMQKVAPEIRQIQDRYKKYSMRDPRKQEMNKEVMAVYSREGVNPMGSCLPQVIQMPIWFGLYRMLNVTIELRHAPWFGGFHDLSGRDPYYILTIAMARAHVRGAEDDADDGDRSFAAAHDDAHAGHVCGHVYHFSGVQRADPLYRDAEHRGDAAAVASQPDVAAQSACRREG